MVTIPVGSNAVLSTPKTVKPGFVPDHAGRYVINLYVNDGKITSAPAAVTIEAIRPNSPPVAYPQKLRTSTAKAVGTVLSGSDPDGDPLTFQVTVPPTNGGLSGIPPQVTYTPKPGFNGNDLIVFRAHDGKVESDPAIVSVEVAPEVAPAPVPPTINNVVLNPSFEKTPAFVFWSITPNSTRVSSTLSTGSMPNGTYSAQVNVKTAGQAADAELRQVIPLSPRGVYRVRFWAKASSNRPLIAVLMQDKNPWGTVGLWQRIPLSSQWQQFDIKFTYTGSESEARLAFRMGDYIGSVWIDNVELFVQP
jgi:hypothetical protein